MTFIVDRTDKEMKKGSVHTFLATPEQSQKGRRRPKDMASQFGGPRVPTGALAPLDFFPDSRYLPGGSSSRVLSC
jgi:hypothetical protein